MIQVTRPFLPPKADYEDYTRQIWSSNWLTNNGPLLLELENRLQEYLKTSNLSIVSNGTISLQIILQLLKRKGQIITTPFSYIATSSSILWEGFEPVFVDIDPSTFNASAAHAESIISDSVVGVLITHCFGVPCDVTAWDHLSKRYNIPVIYDAAHAFGVKINHQSILNFGYASSLSFHATKLYHTTEGGAIVVHDPEHVRQVHLRRNFGHDGLDRFSSVGINGKMSEFHAAMGLTNLRYIEEIFSSRKEQYLYYSKALASSSLGLSFQLIPDGVEYNYSYFPVLFPSEDILQTILKHYAKVAIYPRRYFYPALNSLSFTKGFSYPTPVAEDISKRILCLPLFYGMTKSEQDSVIEVILNFK